MRSLWAAFLLVNVIYPLEPANANQECLSGSLYALFDSNSNGAVLKHSPWWKAIAARANGYQRTGLTNASEQFAAKMRALTGKRLMPEQIEEIDALINQSSSTLRDIRSLKELEEEFALMVANGGMGVPPKDPALLRKFRKEATKFARDHVAAAKAKSKPLLDESLIARLHSKLTNGTDMPARYRTHQPITGGETTSGSKSIFEYMPGSHVAPAMNRFLAELSHKIAAREDPINTAIWIERTLVSIHPFEDANGRLSREVAAAYLYSQGIPRPLFLRGQEHSFAILPDPNFPMLDQKAIRKI